MKKITLFAVVVFVVGAPAAGAAAPPTKAQQLQTYLRAVQPQAAKVARAVLTEEATRVLFEADMAVDGSLNPEHVARLRAACRTIGLASAAVKRVARPAFLAEPHASLVAGWRAEAVGCARYATASENGSSRAEDDLDIALEFARKDQGHWRTEVTVQIRRLGLVVPKWVRAVGTDPLA